MNFSRFYFLLSRFYVVLLLSTFYFLFSATTAQAATLYFSPSFGNYAVGNIFTVDILVNTEGVAINNAEAVINFPKDLLEIVSVSKSESIFSLWVEEPTFSNSAGILSFNGGLLTPGYKDSRGKILSAIFRAKKAGLASLLFSSAAVRANDGYGTDVFRAGPQAQFTLIPEEALLTLLLVTPPVAGAPAAPKISSPTHPDSETWYSDNSPKFIWSLPEDVNALRLLVGKIPTVQQTVIYEPPISERQLENLADGVWYFSAQFRNRVDWGRISRFKFQIDTAPPLPFEIGIKEGRETTHPQPTLLFETTDETSGTDYYEVKIDLEPVIKIKETEYKMPLQGLGKHTIIVKAVDKAGNSTLAMTEIDILAIEAPVITDYPKELLPDNILSIKGTALPESTVKVYIQKDEKEIKTGETKSDQEGKWVFIEVEPVEKGVYQVWAEALDSQGARSKPSEKVTVLASPPVFIRIGKIVIDHLTTVIPLLVLIFALLVIIL